MLLPLVRILSVDSSRLPTGLRGAIVTRPDASLPRIGICQSPSTELEAERLICFALGSQAWCHSNTSVAPGGATKRASIRSALAISQLNRELDSAVAELIREIRYVADPLQHQPAHNAAHRGHNGM